MLLALSETRRRWPDGHLLAGTHRTPEVIPCYWRAGGPIKLANDSERKGLIMDLRRLTRLVCASVAMAMLAAGCGGDDGDRARTVEPTSTTTSSSEPSNTSSDGGAGNDDESSTNAALEDVVVKLSDLPSGWTGSPPENDDKADDTFCDDADPLVEIEPVQEAEANFQQSDFGPFLVSLAGRYDSEDTAKDVMDRFADAVDVCQSFTEVDEDGVETSYTFSPLSFPDLGDDTYAARLNGTTAFGPVALDMVFTRVDDKVLAVMNGGFGAADTALTEQMLRLMVDRL